MKRFILAAAVLSICCHSVFAQNCPVTTDEVFFTEALDLDYPGLEAVKADAAISDWASAKMDFVKYLKTREKPVWYFDWRTKAGTSGLEASYDTSEADKYASNLLVSCSVWHQFGDTINWSVNPTPNGYCEWTWQLGRHYYWSELARAYRATGDEKYARAFVRQMRSWVLQNPLPQDAANVPNSKWRTIESGIRMSDSWPDAFFGFLSSPSFDDESIFLMVKSFYEHGLHLRAFPQTNNWLTMEMDGLFHIGILFPEFKLSEEWRKYASNRLYEEIHQQFYPDGAQKELACGYHGVSLKNMLKIYPLAQLNGYALPEDYLKLLENCCHYYVNITLPQGCVPALNDSEWVGLRGILSEVRDYFPDNSDIAYVASAGKEGKEPYFKSIWMPWAGWAVMRSGWSVDDLYSIMEVGPLGVGHYHDDKLSVIISAYGRRLLTEAGNYAYDSSQWRKYVVSARAHNVTRVDGNDQSRSSVQNNADSLLRSHRPLENRWISNETADFAEGWYSDGFGPSHDRTVTHYRALSFLKKSSCWLLVDVFNPSDDAEHSYETWFHLNSTECVPALNGGYTSCDEGKSNLAIVPLRIDAPSGQIICGQEKPEVQGWIPRYDSAVYECTPIATPTFTRKAAGQCVEPYILCPSRPGETVRLKKIRQTHKGYVIRFTDGTSVRIAFKVGNDSMEELTINGEKIL